jgi:hypothetical protein
VTAREPVEARFHFLHGEASGIVFHAELVEAVECVHVFFIWRGIPLDR